MSKTELYEFDAVPSWAGYIYQGYVGIYISLKYILDDNISNDDLNDYELIFETLEDICVRCRKKIISIHQVKSKKDTTFSKYEVALKQLMYEKGFAEIETNASVQAFLHIRRKITDITEDDISTKMNKIAKQVKQAYRIIEKYYQKIIDGKLTQNSRKRLLKIIQKDYFSVNRKRYNTAMTNVTKCLDDGSLDLKEPMKNYMNNLKDYVSVSNINSDIKLYKYNTNHYIEYGDLEEEIIQLVSQYTSKIHKNYTLDEIKYIYNLLSEKVLDNITQRHKNFDDDNQNKVITFKEIFDILNNSLDDYNKKRNILALKNILYKRIFMYCDTECEQENNCDKCMLREMETEFFELSEEDFVEFCYALNPDCTCTIDNIESLAELMTEDGLFYCFFKGIKELKTDCDFINNHCFYNIDKVNQLLSAIFVVNDRGLNRAIKKIQINVQDNKRKEDLANLFEADKIIISGAESDSTIWNKEVIKNAYENDDMEKEKQYVVNFKYPDIVDVNKLIDRGN